MRRINKFFVALIITKTCSELSRTISHKCPVVSQLPCALCLICIFLFALCLLPCGKAAAQTLLNESFEFPFATSGLTVLNLGGDPAGETWILLQNDVSVPPHTGSYVAFSQDGADNYPNPQIPMEEWLVSPAISVPANSYLSLKFWQMYRWANYGDRPKYVMVSTTTITPAAFDTLIILPNQGTTTWTEVVNNYITGYAGQQIYLAFVFTSGGYADAWAIDDVLLESFPVSPSDVGVLSINNPVPFTLLNTPVYPQCVIKNFGSSAITGNFMVSYNVVNDSSQMLYSDVIIHTGTLPAGNTETITFPIAWTPDTIGNYTFSFSTSLFGDQNTSNDTLIVSTEVYRHYGTGGPDAFGYQWIDSKETAGLPFNWIEISQTGTSAITYNTSGNFAGDNNLSEPIPFGFNFPYYGTGRPYFYADINGEILLADNSWSVTYPLTQWNNDGNPFNYVYPVPGYTAMPALVAVLWDDLIADNGTGNVYFQTFGTAPNRYCVVEWNNLRYNYVPVTDTSLAFEAVFHENGEIVFQYKNVNIGQTSGAVQHDNGHSATVGIQNNTANIGLCYLKEIYQNTNYFSEPIGNLLTDSLAIRFYTGTDIYPPIFTFSGKGNTFESSPVVKINIADMSKIKYDTLYYNTGSGWQAVSHFNFIYPDTFIYQLPAMANNTTVNYYFAATDSSVNQNRGTLPVNAPAGYYSFKILPTAGVNVLLARSAITDANNTELTAFSNALNNAGVLFDIYNWDKYPAYAFPAAYKAIFVYANNASAADIYDTLSRALMTFLNTGTTANPKNIFMASDNFGYAGYGYANDKPMLKFFNAYLRCGYVPQENPPYYGGTDGIGGPGIYDYSSGSIVGVASSPLGYNGIEIPVYSNTPDVIDGGIVPSWYESEVTNPYISSELAFKFEDGPNAGQAYSYHNPCGIWLDNLIYKSFFLSFDLSQLINANDRDSVIIHALNWFDITTGITTQGANNDEGLQIYPNPSNGVFTVMANLAYRQAGDKMHTERSVALSLPKGRSAKLEIYNSLGELILSQSIRQKPQIDISTFPKGIYFLKVNLGNKVVSKKIITN